MRYGAHQPFAVDCRGSVRWGLSAIALKQRAQVQIERRHQVIGHSGQEWALAILIDGFRGCHDWESGWRICLVAFAAAAVVVPTFDVRSAGGGALAQFGHNLQEPRLTWSRELDA